MTDPTRHLVNVAAPAMRKVLRRVAAGQFSVDDAVDVLLGWPNREAATPSLDDTVVEWGARWADGGYCPATPPRSEDFAHKHARNFGTRAIYRKVGPWKYADTGEDAFPEQADRGIAAGEDQL